MAAKTPISALQEYCVKNFLPLPRYETANVPANANIGSHFKCTVIVDKIVEVGIGQSKQIAKQESAKKAIAALTSKFQDNPIAVALTKFNSTVGLVKEESVDGCLAENAVGLLNEYSSKNGMQYPTYSDYSTPDGAFIVQCKHLSFESFGEDIKKKVAKQKAAARMMQM